MAFHFLISSAKKVHVHILYCLLGIQFTYILNHHLAYYHDTHLFLPNGLGSSLAVKEVALTKPKICKSRDDYYEDEGGVVQKEDPWQQMKWIGSPASCSVRNQLIEKLDEELNFRRGFALMFHDPYKYDDKTHLLPWLLGSRVNLNSRSRRVYLDLGAEAFNSSVLWFLRMYPCDFTEVHAFEPLPELWAAPEEAFDEEANLLETPVDYSIFVKATPGVPRWMLDRIHVHHKFAAHDDDESKGHVNITRFMKEELKLKRSDTVIVKMDIEGSEWPVLEAWLADPEMPSLIDELFVEVHYAHPSMSAFGWDHLSSRSRSRQDAKRLLADLRWKGFYAHFWV